MSFDTERFISEIEKRRALWDMSCEDYSNRDLKRMMWEEITEMFGGENSTINEKKELGISLQKKWKNIRDSFLRELRRIKGTKSGSAATRKSPYIYFHHLMFLKPTVEPNNTESNLNDAENRDPNPSIQESVFQRSSSSKRKKEDNNLEKEDLVSILKESINSRNERESRNEDDSDRLFLLSLVKDFKKIPESAKMTTKVEIINLIHRAQNRRYEPSHYNHMTSHSQPSYPRSSFPNTIYHQEYRQGYFTQPPDNIERLAAVTSQPSMSLESPTMDLERQSTPESNYSQASQHSEMIEMFINN